MLLSNQYQAALGGVGGQGIITMSEIIGEAAMRADIPVTSSETHGMAQRGGSVVVQIKLGKSKVSPTIAEGQADLLVALEAAEVLRYIRLIKPNGAVIANTIRLVPPSYTQSRREYPDLGQISHMVQKFTDNFVYVDTDAVLREIPEIRSPNIPMLGAIGEVWDRTATFPITSSLLLTTIKDRWPDWSDLNSRAFMAGQKQIPALLTAI